MIKTTTNIVKKRKKQRPSLMPLVLFLSIIFLGGSLVYLASEIRKTSEITNTKIDNIIKKIETKPAKPKPKLKPKPKPTHRKGDTWDGMAPLKVY